MDGGNLAEVWRGRDAHLAEEAVQGKLHPVFSALRLAIRRLRRLRFRAVAFFRRDSPRHPRRSLGQVDGHHDRPGLVKLGKVPERAFPSSDGVPSPVHPRVGGEDLNLEHVSGLRAVHRDRAGHDVRPGGSAVGHRAVGPVEAARLRAVLGAASLRPDGSKLARDVPLVHRDPAGFARDGPQVHDVAAVHLGDRGVPSAPPGDADEWDGAGDGVQFGVKATRRSWICREESMKAIFQFAGDDDDDAVTHPPKWTVSGLGRTTTSAPDAAAAASDSASDAASADRIVGSGRRRK